MKKMVLGIDIGGTNSRLGFVDENGCVLARTRMATQAQEPPDRLWARLWDEAQRLWCGLLSLPGERMDWVGIGIGAPNAHRGRGSIEHPPNLGWEIVPFLDLVSEKTEIPAWLANDANVAALAEGRFGAAKGVDNFLLITLGTGLGSGLVVNGSMVEGASGFAAEMGHIPLVDKGRQCGCGRQGCLETYASATGLKRTLLELWAERGGNSALLSMPPMNLTAEQIGRAAEAGDELACEALTITAAHLARGLVTVIHLLSPAAILIGGGLSLAGEGLMAPLRRDVERGLMAVFCGSCQIRLAGIPEADLGIMGAGALAFQGLEFRSAAKD